MKNYKTTVAEEVFMDNNAPVPYGDCITLYDTKNNEYGTEFGQKLSYDLLVSCGDKKKIKHIKTINFPFENYNEHQLGIKLDPKIDLSRFIMELSQKIKNLGAEFTDIRLE